MIFGIISLACSFLISAFIAPKISNKKISWLKSIGIGFLIMIVLLILLDLTLEVDPNRSSSLVGGVSAMAIFGMRSDLFRTSETFQED